MCFILEHREAVFSLTPLIFVCPSVHPCVRLSFVIKLVITSPPKPLNGLSSYFHGMFPQSPSCAYFISFFNMCNHLSVNQLSFSLSYFH